jgi:hypothetical protein
LLQALAEGEGPCPACPSWRPAWGEPLPAGAPLPAAHRLTPHAWLLNQRVTRRPALGGASLAERRTSRGLPTRATFSASSRPMRGHAPWLPPAQGLTPRAPSAAHCNFLQDSPRPCPQTAHGVLKPAGRGVDRAADVPVGGHGPLPGLALTGARLLLVVRTGLAGAGVRPSGPAWALRRPTACSSPWRWAACRCCSRAACCSGFAGGRRAVPALSGLDELAACGAATLEAPTARNALHPAPRHARACFWPGLWSGLLNPKNALFYASLAALLGPGCQRGLEVADRPLDGAGRAGLGHAGGQRAGPRHGAPPFRPRAAGAGAGLRRALATSGAAVCVAAGWRR